MRFQKFIMMMLMAVLSISLTQIPVGSDTSTTQMSLDYDTAVYEYMQLDETLEGGGLGGLTASSDFGTLGFWADMVDSEQVSNTGEGIYVAVLDTGLAPFWSYYFPTARVKAEWGKGFTHDISWDSVAKSFTIGPLRDDRGFITNPRGSGHGTHVTSTIIGFNFAPAARPETGYFPPPLFYVRGVAPMVTIIPVLVLDAWYVTRPPADGGPVLLTGGTHEMVAAGIRYIGDLAAREHIKIVINLSLGAISPSALIEDAINYAIGNGVIVVAAAGNNGAQGMIWPAAFPQVISAGAGGWTLQFIGSGSSPHSPPYRWWLSDVPETFNTVDALGNDWQHYLVDFSSRPNSALDQSWKELDATTPGTWVVGPFKGYSITPAYTYRYFFVSGTSMATPHISSISSMVLQSVSWFTQEHLSWVFQLASVRMPMPRDEETAGATVWHPTLGKYVSYTWNDHDYGRGFLQADEALWAAYVLTSRRGGSGTETSKDTAYTGA